ncbi:MAG: DUF2752 domain-containing protein [Bacillota bacterium]|jgi:hypothetical protein
MKGIRSIFAKIFPAPNPGEKMSPGERLLLSGIILIGLAAVLYFTVDWPWDFYWGNYSLFRHLDFYCPACGGSRSIYHLVRGELGLAWQNNQLFILSLPLILWGGFTVLRAVLTGYPITGKYLHPLLIWGFLAAVIVFGILRNIPLEIFDCLRPPT